MTGLAGAALATLPEAGKAGQEANDEKGLLLPKVVEVTLDGAAERLAPSETGKDNGALADTDDPNILRAALASDLAFSRTSFCLAVNSAHFPSTHVHSNLSVVKKV